MGIEPTTFSLEPYIEDNLTSKISCGAYSTTANQHTDHR